MLRYPLQVQWNPARDTVREKEVGMTYASEEYRHEPRRRGADENRIVKPDVEARQAVTGHHVWVVLGVGTAAAAGALMLLWMIFSL